MIENISASYLLAIGILLIGLEAITFSFVLFFLGFGFIVISGISLVYVFDNATIQIAAAFIVALISTYFFRRKLLKRLSRFSDKKEHRSHVFGVGFVDDGMVKFDGTYWKTLDDLSAYKDGDKINIEDVRDNMVIIKK